MVELLKSVTQNIYVVIYKPNTYGLPLSYKIGTSLVMVQMHVVLPLPTTNHFL